jgi:ABC-type glycerol-3-phosphate transport system substrate-binding protein
VPAAGGIMLLLLLLLLLLLAASGTAAAPSASTPVSVQLPLINSHALKTKKRSCCSPIYSFLGLNICFL